MTPDLPAVLDLFPLCAECERVLSPATATIHPERPHRARCVARFTCDAIRGGALAASTPTPEEG